MRIGALGERVMQHSRRANLENALKFFQIPCGGHDVS
jgi:hypothetical protein